MTDATTVTPLDNIAFVYAEGTDASDFLEGQFTNTLADLTVGASRFGAFCSPKGRAFALARIASVPGGLLLAVDRAVAKRFVTTLARYVMRANVTLSVREDLRALGVVGDPGAAADGEACRWPVAGTGEHRVTLLAVPVTDPPRHDPASAANIELRLIRAGLPSLDVATLEQFVPQMLNLDRLAAISFNKGCYTGQEIVARMQNLGRIKRRMLRFECASSHAFVPGQAIVNRSGDTVGQVVRAATLDTRQELLAVVRLSELGAGLYSGGSESAPLMPLPLPYEIPELDAGR